MAITVYYKTVGVAAYGISNPVGARLYYCSNQRVQVTDEKTTNELYGPQDATQVGRWLYFLNILLRKIKDIKRLKLVSSGKSGYTVQSFRTLIEPFRYACPGVVITRLHRHCLER